MLIKHKLVNGKIRIGRNIKYPQNAKKVKFKSLILFI